MQARVNTYTGMNKDVAYDTLPENLYIDALDIRISTVNGQSTGAFTNMKGNVESFTIPNSGVFTDPKNPSGPPILWTADSPEIIGYTTIRNRIIIFVADNSDAKGWIYDVQYDPATRIILSGFPVLKYYSSAFNFKKDWPIEALGRYESDCIQRVYWTDYNNFFRTINLEDTNLDSTPVGLIDNYPNVEFRQPLLKIVAGGGSLKAGEYQAAYRLITFDGKETLVSPPSNLVHVVSSSESLTQSAQYVGEPTAINTGKSLTFQVDTTGYEIFDKIEFLVLYFETGTAVPLAQSVETQNIGNNTSISFTYTGNEGSLTTVELFDFTVKNIAFKTPKTITHKDSTLVAANIKGSQVRLADLLESGESFDASTLRYLNDGTSTPASGSFNTEYNLDAHWDEDWHNNMQYKYQNDGITLGGSGVNINYKFHLEPMSLDGDTQAGFNNISPVLQTYDNHDLNDGYGVYTNNSFPSNTSPFISGLLRGYKRGETYRFGIIFYTLKGEATFVEYIGDIKFPDISEPDGANNLSGTPYFILSQQDPSNPNITIGYNLGIEFTIDLSTCPNLQNKITGYQIVRVERTDVDKRRLCQGYIRSYYYQEVGNNPGPDYDFRVGTNEAVYHLIPAAVSSNVIGPIPAFTISPDIDTLYWICDQFDLLNNTRPQITTSGNTRIRSSLLAFYSPEISYKLNNIIDTAVNAGNTPCFLMTGAHSFILNNQDFVINASDYVPNSGLDLGNFLKDYRIKYREVVPISYNSIENIKKIKNSVYFNMPDNSTIIDKVFNIGPVFPNIAPLDSNSWIRNYFVFNQFGSINSTLNNPDGTGPNEESPLISRSGSNISTLTEKISVDPITGNSLTTFSPADYFIIDGNTSFPNGITPIGVNTNQAVPIIDLVLPKTEIYGGFNQDALESNTFIIASPIIETSNLNPIVFGGDIFITMPTIQIATTEFDKNLYKLGDYKYMQSVTTLRVTETSINTELDYGSTIKREVKYTVINGSTTEEQTYFRQENNNTFTFSGKVSDMYGYNLVNSRENNQVNFAVEPLNQNNTCIVNDVRTYLSDVKTNNETIDSWTKFALNNFYDIDDFGPINKIINYKDNVFFFQDRAVGVYAINRAAVTTSLDGVPTQLGQGQGFGKHQYYSKENGSIHQWAVKSTDSGIYFFDSLHRKIFLIGTTTKGEAQNAPLSEIKGIHSFLQVIGDGCFYKKEKGGDNPILSKGVHIGKDVINDEVIFTFLGSGIVLIPNTNTTYYPGDIVVINAEINYYVVVQEEITTGGSKPAVIDEILAVSETLENLNKIQDTSIVFDEITTSFSCRLSQTPKIWIDNADTLLSPNLSEANSSVYIHNIGNYGEFYGNITECSLSLVINEQADINKILRTIEFNSIVRDDNKVIDRTKTITAFRIQNEYQDTGKILYSSGRIKRRFDKWRVKIPRDINNNKARLRSSYFIVTLYFDNTENKELIMNRLISYFDYQIF
jgi:hypothetical protein